LLVFNKFAPAGRPLMAMIFDTKTIFFVYVVLAIINSIAAAVVWIENRHLRGVPEISAAYILSGIGLAIQSVAAAPATPLMIFFANLLLNLSLGLCVNGFGIFLGRANRIWLPVSCAVFTILVWPPALYFALENRSIRIAAATVVTLVTFGYLTVAISQSRNTLGWAGRVIGLLSVGHMGFILVRGYWALQDIPSYIDANAPLDVWTALESIIFSNSLFIGFLAMVGSRLNHDLRARNQVLSDEIVRRLTLERQLSSALATEMRLRSEQQQLIHIVGHEIRSPLAGIDRAAELLILADAAIARRVDGIRERVRRTIDMIDRLLAFERNSHALARPERLAVDQMIGIVVRGFDDFNTAHRIHVNMPDSPLYFIADQGMVMAILRNLIENALKYSPPNEPVMVTAKQGDGEVAVIISDRGIGIPTAERALIGQRFFRASNVGTISGTGLGIFAVNQLLAAQGGRLMTQDGPDGKGTDMTVTFPLTHPGITPIPTDV
jgi:two-component system, OmpR family, sensor kinase